MPTNYQMIREMSVEEMAVTIMCPNDMGLANIQCDAQGGLHNCRRCCLEWLQSQGEDEIPEPERVQPCVYGGPKDTQITPEMIPTHSQALGQGVVPYIKGDRERHERLLETMKRSVYPATREAAVRNEQLMRDDTRYWVETVLSETLQGADLSIQRLEMSEDEATARIIYTNGHTRNINVAGNSRNAIALDVIMAAIR